MLRSRHLLLCFVLVCLPASLGRGADDVAAALRALDPNAIPAELTKEKKPGEMLWRHERRRIQEANQRETAGWRAVKTRADWEKYRDARLVKLRESLGQYPEGPKELKVLATAEREGDGFRIENLVFESRPGLVATANLYVPAPVRDKMPGIIIIPSHHNPKSEGELQDMGMTWARLGCLVLVMDSLGHGERASIRSRPEKSYPKPYRVGRQDYYSLQHRAATGHDRRQPDGLDGVDYMRGSTCCCREKGSTRTRSSCSAPWQAAATQRR